MADNNIPYTVTDEAHKQNIAELQGYLSSYFDSFIIPDGVYNDATRSAVTSFQRASGLEPTGEVDRETWEALYSAYMKKMENTLSLGIMPFPGTDAVLAEGDSGIVIVMLQAMLNMLSGVYSNIPAVEITGEYDPDTQRLVSVIQAVTGLPVTGKTDIITWNNIVRLFNFQTEETLINNSQA